jgi:hypothetical protein
MATDPSYKSGFSVRLPDKMPCLCSIAVRFRVRVVVELVATPELNCGQRVETAVETQTLSLQG